MTHHGEALRQETKDGKLVQAIKHDYRRAPLDSATRALLEYAEKVTRDPARMARDDVDRLRKEGFSDETILDATCVAAFFNYVNRMSDGLGIEMEEIFKEQQPSGRNGDG